MTGRRLIITRHAVAAYSRRRNDTRSLRELANSGWNLDELKRAGYDQEELKHLTDLYGELENEIRQCVSYALANGLALNHKPEGFVLYHRKKNRLPARQRFVRCAEDSNYGFVVKRDPDGDDVVVTTLTKVGVRR